MRRTILTAATVAVCSLLVACSPGVDPQAAASAASRSSMLASAEARRVASNDAANASWSAAATASSSAAAAASASAAAASAAAAASSSAAAAKPRVYTGSGDSVIKIDEPGGSICLATITGNKASREFAVKGVDGERDLLVNTTDPYSGTTLLDAREGGTTQLQVSAVGAWSITLAPIASAPDLNTGANSGTGDAVLKYLGSSGVATITGNKSSRELAVLQHTSSDRNLLVNTTDPYQGSVPLAAGPALIEVNAVGAWSINVG